MIKVNWKFGNSKQVWNAVQPSDKCSLAITCSHTLVNSLNWHSVLKRLESQRDDQEHISHDPKFSLNCC